MKTKFLTALIAIFFITPTLSFAAKEPVKSKQEKASKISVEESENALSNVSDLKTFDFERIFREADAYFNAAQKWNTLKCFPKSGFLCSKHVCPELKLHETAVLLLDKNKEVAAICRNKICQYYVAKFTQTGVFINVAIKDVSEITIKVLGDSRFKEIALIGLDAYITNGECIVLE